MYISGLYMPHDDRDSTRACARLLCSEQRRDRGDSRAYLHVIRNTQASSFRLGQSLCAVVVYHRRTDEMHGQATSRAVVPRRERFVMHHMHKPDDISECRWVNVDRFDELVLSEPGWLSGIVSSKLRFREEVRHVEKLLAFQVHWFWLVCTSGGRHFGRWVRFGVGWAK